MLAEDRILCFELVAKSGCNYTLGYVNKAVGETDVPSDLATLLKQRRRWLNGSFFALIYALQGFMDFWRRSAHRKLTKAAITWEFFFFCISVMVQWFAIAAFLIISVVVSIHLEIPQSYWVPVSSIFTVLVILQFIVAVQNDPVRYKNFYRLSSFLFGVFFSFLMVITVVFSFEEIAEGSVLIVIGLFLSWGIFIVGALLHGELISLVGTFFQYMFMMPTVSILCHSVVDVFRVSV